MRKVNGLNIKTTSTNYFIENSIYTSGLNKIPAQGHIFKSIRCFINWEHENGPEDRENSSCRVKFTLKIFRIF